jgi:pyruvate/2-oxoglutarate dehydrogenase complex dihydrolipoamide dehydrogenase (E3) component
LDTDAVARLQVESEQRIGLQISTGVRIERIEATAGRFRVIFTHEGIEKAVEADWVVNGAGRIADVESLGLAAGQVDHDNGRIAICARPQIQSSMSAATLSLSRQLSPIATYEGDLVCRNIVDGAMHSPDYAKIATAVYTVPALAAVGLTEACVKARGVRIARRYRLNSQPAFPEAKGLRDADYTAGQFFGAATSMFNDFVTSRKIWQALGVVSAIAISLATACKGMPISQAWCCGPR